VIDFDAALAPAVQAAFGQAVTYTRKTAVTPDEWDTETVLPDLLIILDTSEETAVRTGGAFEAWVRESDFGGIPPAKGDRLELEDGTEYTVMDVRPDQSQPASEGGRKLQLRRV
jgi:hypothetical protein